MTSYSVSDAIREVTPVLDHAPAGAVSGEWIATPMLAGSSSCEGGYSDANEQPVRVNLDNSEPSFELFRPSFKIIAEVVEKLAASHALRFNKVTVRWSKAETPSTPGRITLKTEFDEALVAREPDDPIYEAAAAARLAFWRTRGNVAADFAAEWSVANIYNQTRWFGPHRRVLAVRTNDRLILATDGLSTPSGGVPTPENGVECELFMEFDIATTNDKLIDDSALMLIDIGDLIADDFGIAATVEKHGAILFCYLEDDDSPTIQVILSRGADRIERLPFGTVPLIRATPFKEGEIEGPVLLDDWGTQIAINALARRGIVIPFADNEAA
ncbi:MAG: hypothetical protein JO221_08255 [Sphingomonas sp.]|nr:hypothetical protein [Sphingomonas sp.]